MSFPQTLELVPVREQQATTGGTEQLKMPLDSSAVECFVLGNHDLNPPVQECCPTLGQKAMAD